REFPPLTPRDAKRICRDIEPATHVTILAPVPAVLRAEECLLAELAVPPDRRTPRKALLAQSDPAPAPPPGERIPLVPQPAAPVRACATDRRPWPRRPLQ